ncbi:MAG: hypothetical protein R3A46_05660 [Thermomicrobiales bacterium]
MAAQSSSDQDTYAFRELCRQVLSPSAVGVLEQLEREILDIYSIDELLDAQLPRRMRSEHADFIIARIRRLSQMLPPDISRTPNEIFTAIEFIVYEILDRPINIGEAWMRLELLAEEFRARPLVHDLVIGMAN